MNLVFDISSSVEFWRQRYPANRTPRAATSTISKDCAFRKQDVLPLVPDWVTQGFLTPLDGTFHALAFDRTQGRQLSGLAVHVWSGPVPEGSFFELQPGVFIESPAFMFLHAATILDMPSPIAFGDELCGLYSFDMNANRGFRKRSSPLLTKERLEQYLLQAIGCQGRLKAMKAFPFVIERSASPMETFDEMTLCLPYRHGGYGLPVPRMNQRVELTPKAARIAKRNACYLDMGYIEKNPEMMLDIEHHGKLDHTSEEDQASDRARVNALKEMGFEVIELTANQVGDLFAYEYIIERIARLLGKRLQKSAMGATPSRLSLRKELYRWNGSSGRIRS